MCKISRQSIFSWIANPFITGYKAYKDKSNNKKIAAAQAQKKQAEEQIEELNKPEITDVEGEMPTPVAPVTPVKTTGTGINNNNNSYNTLPRIGLNL